MGPQSSNPLNNYLMQEILQGGRYSRSKERKSKKDSLSQNLEENNNFNSEDSTSKRVGSNENNNN